MSLLDFDKLAKEGVVLGVADERSNQHVVPFSVEFQGGPQFRGSFGKTHPSNHTWGRLRRNNVQDPTPIRKCVCFDISFVDLKRSGCQTVEEIVDMYGCTSGCGLCEPYIRLLLQTGQTEFAIMRVDGPPDTGA